MPEQANILFGGDVRAFVQSNGVNPASSFNYFGRLQLSGPTQSQPDPDPVYVPSSSQHNAWEIVDRVPKAQELGSADWTQKADRYLQDDWWEIRRKKCLFNVMVTIGRCTNPSDLTQWESKLLLRDVLLSGDFGFDGDMNILAGGDNAEVMLKGSFTFTAMEPIYSLRFSPKADVQIVAEVLDGIFYDSVSCGDCGPVSDGRAKSYYLTLANSGSPGLSSQIVASTDNDNTYFSVDIPTLGGLSGTRLAVVGTKLVVISQPNNAHHYASLADINSALANWSRVSTGYVATKGPRAIWSRDAANTFIAAAGGYVYFMADPTGAVSPITDGSATTQDMNDIDGRGQIIVAVGNSNAVLVSTDGGAGFSLVTGPVPGVALNAVQIVAPYVWWVGTANGRLFYTMDQGTTWTEKVISANINIIYDIKFVDQVVGYLVVGTTAGPAVYRTLDSGFSWQNTAPSILALPTAERYNFAAVSGYNKVAVGGRVSAGGDGKLAVAG